MPPSYLLTDDRKQQLEDLATTDEQTFRKWVKHSAINRIKHSQLLRNIVANSVTQLESNTIPKPSSQCST